MKLKNHTLPFYLWILTAALLTALSAVCTFGQQALPVLSIAQPAYRIPQHKLQWQSYQSSGLQLYFSTGMDSVARFVLQHFESSREALERKSGLKLQGKPNLIIYPSVTHTYESRIGSADPGTASFPTIVRQGNRIVLGFNGSYAGLERELRIACIRSMWQRSFGYYNGTDLRSYTTAMDWNWFKEGAIHYLATGFSLEDNEALYQYTQTHHVTDWAQLLRDADSEAQRLIVQSFCYFIERNYREDALKQVLFQLKRKKAFATAVRLVCKQSLTQIQERYINALKTAYEARTERDTSLQSTAERIVFQSPDSSYSVSVTGHSEARTVWLQRSGAARRKLYHYQLPPWIEDHSWDVYPLVQVSGQKIYIIAPDKDRLVVRAYNRSGARLDARPLPPGIDGVSSFYPLHEREWLMTAYTKGRSDLIRFQPGRLKVIPVTNDLADQLHAQPEEEERVFRYYSGYPDYIRGHSGKNPQAAPGDTLRGKPYGWYRIAIDGSGSEQLISSDSAVLQQLTGQLAYPDSLRWYQRYWLDYAVQRQHREDSLNALEQSYRQQEARSGSSFLGGLLQPGKDSTVQEDPGMWYPDKVQPYMLQLHTLWFQAAINNDYFINRLQPYQGYMGTYRFPELGGLFQGGYSDLLEQHQFHIGYKLPAGAEGSDFFIRYHNLQRRLDWYALYYRKVESLQPDPDQLWTDAQGRPYPAAAKVKTYYYELGFNYPFSYYSALGFTSAFRKGRTVFLATDRYSLPYPALEEQWSISTISLKHQHLRASSAHPSFFRGFRNKFMLDVLIRAGKPTAFAYGINNQFEWHQPLHPAINWVSRVQLGYSGGAEHILYTMGGLDHNVTVAVDSSVHFAQDAPYVFQSLVTRLRGFRQNSLYGNAYGVLNTDVYAQLLGGLFDARTPYSFINKMQLGLFLDVALAGETWRPGYLWQERHSFGCSLKTVLAGYPMRLDLAFPYNLAHRPMLHFALSL